MSYSCSGVGSQVTANAFTGGAGTYQISTQLYTSESFAYGGVFVAATSSKVYPIGTNQQYWVALRDAVNNSNVLAKTITPNCTTTTTTAAPTTTTAAPTTTTLPPTTTTTTTLPPLVISNGAVTCSGTTGSFTASFSGGTSTYNFVAIANSQANAASCVAGGACGTGGFRVTLGGGATSHNFSGIANGNWYTAVRDSLPQTSVQNTAVSINCTTTTTTAAPTTTTAAPTTTTLPPTTTTTTTLPPLVISNGAVTCSGTTGSFTASFSGGTSTYNFVAIANSQANAASCVAGGACGTGGFRVTLGGGATSHNFSGIANGNWYTAVRDTLPQTSVQNTAVSINCTTTTTVAPTTTTTTAAPTTTTTTTEPPPPLDYFEYTATICDGGTSNIITSSSLSVGSYYYITGGTPTTCYYIDSFVGMTATSPNISFGGFATDCSDTTNCTQL